MAIRQSCWFAAEDLFQPSRFILSYFTWSRDNVERFDSLDAQESKNYELGTKWEFFDDSLLLNAAAFITTKTVLDRDEQRVYFLAGEQEAKGFELSAVGKINDQLKHST